MTLILHSIAYLPVRTALLLKGPTATAATAATAATVTAAATATKSRMGTLGQPF